MEIFTICILLVLIFDIYQITKSIQAYGPKSPVTQINFISELSALVVRLEHEMLETTDKEQILDIQYQLQQAQVSLYNLKNQ